MVETTANEVIALEGRLGYVDSDSEAVSAWLGDVLEFVSVAECSSATGEWLPAGWRVLLSFGGPNLWVEGRTGSGSVEVSGHWGSESVTRFAYVPALADIIAEFIEVAR